MDFCPANVPLCCFDQVFRLIRAAPRLRLSHPLAALVWTYALACDCGPLWNLVKLTVTLWKFCGNYSVAIEDL